MTGMLEASRRGYRVKDKPLGRKTVMSFTEMGNERQCLLR